VKIFFFTLLTLLFTSCVIYKKRPAQLKIIDINKLPLTVDQPKCIVLKFFENKNLPNTEIKCFHFFTADNIYIYSSNKMPLDKFGYYNFEKNTTDSNSHIHLKYAIQPTNNIHVKNKYIKKPLDSIYMHFKLATIEGFPFNKDNPLIVYKTFPEQKIMGRDSISNINNFSLSILLDRPDSTEFIITFKRDSSTKNIHIFPYSQGFNIDSTYNFYEITGSTCFINQENTFPAYWSMIGDYRFEITQVSNNNYEFAQIFLKDSINVEKNIYMWQSLDLLSIDEKAKIYSLPTIKKILDCCGTYPPK
jgi:hypothetical protein